MKKRFTILLSFLTVALINSCDDDGGGSSVTVETGSTLTAAMGSDLYNQIYIDLSTGEMTSIDVASWDLAFENDGDAIRCNTAKKMAVAFPDETDFDAVTDDADLTYAYDDSDASLTGTALYGWETNQPYIIDLGLDINGNTIGTKKIMITAKTTTTVSIQFADLDGSNAQTADITLGEGNFTYYSLINAQTVSVEPASWDIVMTAVTLRTGAVCSALGASAVPGTNCDIYRVGASAITNTYDGVAVAVDNPHADLEEDDDPDAEINQQTIESSNYADLTLADYTTLGASTEADAIGRTWFQILTPHSSGVYAVYSFITYLVKDTDGNYYKLRFLAYKGGDNAENGYPTFEYALMTE